MQPAGGDTLSVAHASPRRTAFAIANVALAFGPWQVRLADVGPVASGFWHVALAAPVLLLVTRAARQPIPPFARLPWRGLTIAGLCFAADLAAWHLGILHTKPANATLFGNSASFFFAGYGFVTARRPPGRAQLIALLLAVAGVALLLGRSYELSARNAAGDLLCLLGGLFYAGYLIAIERVRATLPA